MKFTNIQEDEQVKFCQENHVNLKSLKEVDDLALQLSEIVKGEKMKNRTKFKLSFPKGEDRENILKSLIGGFIDQIAMKIEIPDDYSSRKRIPFITSESHDISMYSDEYRKSGVNLDHCFVHPTSYLFSNAPPELIAYQHLIFTRRPCLMGITKVKPEWLLELGGNLLQSFKVLDTPNPEYVSEEDSIKAWVSCSFSKRNWALTPVFTHFPENDEFIYLWFLRLLLEGKILTEFKELSKNWSIKIASITNEKASGVQMQIANLLANLKKNKIKNREGFLKKISERSSFMLAEFEKVTQPNKLSELRKAYNIITQNE